jgi:hypothetical protein
MVSEKTMEDAICNDPEKYLGEKGLKLIKRQFSIGECRYDLLFEDRYGGKLIVELQKGTLDRDHFLRIMYYQLEYRVKYPNEFTDLWVIANRIPYDKRNKLDSLGIKWKEIAESEFGDTIGSHTDPDKFDSRLTSKGEAKFLSKISGGYGSVDALSKAYTEYPEKELGHLLQKILDWSISEGIFMLSPGAKPGFRLRSKSNPEQGAVTFSSNGTIQVYFNNILGSAEKRAIFDEIMKINPLKNPDNPDNIKRSKDLQYKLQEMSESEIDNLLLTIRKYCD